MLPLVVVMPQLAVTLLLPAVVMRRLRLVVLCRD
jgi:hypothetical protein